MSETVERNNRFYEQSNGEMLTENEQLKKWLVIANKHNEELQKERDMYKTSFETMSTNYFRLENIIKEVREYIKEHSTTINFRTMRADYNLNMNELLQILDKEVS